MPTTPNWALRYPASTDNNDVPLHMSQLAADADNMAQFAKGTFAARPAAATAKSGKYYLATDTGVLYLSDGTNWIEVSPGAGSVPIGAMIDWAHVVEPTDTRFLMAEGRALSRTTYAELWNLIGTRYGAGNGSTTFNIPDTRGRTTVADTAGSGRLTVSGSAGSAGGTEFHTLTTAQMPSHSHTPRSAFYLEFNNNFGGGVGVHGSATHYDMNNLYGSTADTGGGGAHNNMQPYIVVNKIIRVQ